MTTKGNDVIIRYIKRDKRSESMLPERKNDMATLNRVYSLYSDRYESSLEKRSEWRLVLMPSYKTKQMRENVALTEIHQD